MLSFWKHPLFLFLEFLVLLVFLVSLVLLVALAFLVFFFLGVAVWCSLSCFLKKEFGNVGQTLRVDVTFNVTFAFVF